MSNDADHIASLEGERDALLTILSKIIAAWIVDSSMGITTKTIGDIFSQDTTEDVELLKRVLDWYSEQARIQNDLRDKLLAALEDIDFLRSLLKTIVEEVSGVYGGHSLESIEALRVAQKLLEGGKPDGK